MTTFYEVEANRTLWYTGLKSGLGQVDGKLANESYDGFCCLGVAPEYVPALGMCRVAGDTGRYTFTEYKDKSLEELTDDIEDEDPEAVVFEGSLPGQVLAKLGLSQDMQSFLIDLNDNAKLSFSAIADIMKRMPMVGDIEDRPAWVDTDWDANKFMYRNVDLFSGAKETWYIGKLRQALGKTFR